MAFRKAKPGAHHRSDEWEGWKNRVREELASIGLPASVYTEEGCWIDFLENGHLH